MIVTVAVYVPAASPLMRGDTLTLAGAEPVPGVTVSQFALAAAVKLSEPPVALPPPTP